MNCDEVIRELAVPTSDHEPGVLASHIAHCPTCAYGPSGLTSLIGSGN